MGGRDVCGRAQADPPPHTHFPSPAFRHVLSNSSGSCSRSSLLECLPVSTALNHASSHLSPTVGNRTTISQVRKWGLIQGNLQVNLPVTPHIRPQGAQRQGESSTRTHRGVSSSQRSINRRMDKQDVVPTPKAALFSLKKLRTSDTCGNTDEP